MTDDNNLNEGEIDDLLARAGDRHMVATGNLVARIVADADAVSDQRDKIRSPRFAPRQAGRLAGILANLGGWPGVAGLTTAAVAGIWIGYASPDTLTGFTDGYITIGLGSDLDDFMPAFTDILDEG